MDIPTKLFFGKLLGEVYRLQRHMQIPGAPDSAKVYGLLHGFLHEIDEELASMDPIKKEEVLVVEDLLDRHLALGGETTLNSFYQIEETLREKGIYHRKALRILKYLSCENRYRDVLEKMNQTYSLIGGKRFTLQEHDC